MHSPIPTQPEPDDELVFADEPIATSSETGADWKILIVDDEEEVHRITRLALSDVVFERRRIDFISAYTGTEAKKVLETHADIAVVLLDVVMEKDDAGLEVAKYIRETLKNFRIRIVLRTGQPGKAPEKEIIVNYDVNDYKAKTELTAQKLFTTTIASLRSYKQLSTIEENKDEISRLYADLTAHSERLKGLIDQRTRQRDMFSKFVPDQFLNRLQITNFEEIKPELAKHIRLSIIFSDIRSFTNLSERMSPKETFNFLNRYYSLMCEPVEEHHGFIDKFIGDGIMALFDRQAADAIRSAIAMRRNLTAFNNHRHINNEPLIQVGIGINTGDLILGTVGSDTRIDSTVIGDSVNIASRIEGLTKVYNAGILITEDTYNSLDDPSEFRLRELDLVCVYGKEKPIRIFEVFDTDDDRTREQKLELLGVFGTGLELYRNRRWDEAIDRMTKSLMIYPLDKVAQIYLQRCHEYRDRPPPENWDGSSTQHEK